jgi:hypothetical protein
MIKMLTKESKIKVLENFYALDYVFFGKPVAKVESCCPILKEEYLSVKGATLSVFIEMLKLIKHSPAELTEKVDTAALMKRAKTSARVARENAQKIVQTNKAKANIKESLKEALKEDKDADLSKLVETKIRQKAFGLAVDNLLLAKTLTEAESLEPLNDWTGQIVEDSYKILRDSLVECASIILESYDEEMLEEDNEIKLESEWKKAIAEKAKKKSDIAKVKGKTAKSQRLAAKSAKHAQAAKDIKSY